MDDDFGLKEIHAHDYRDPYERPEMSIGRAVIGAVIIVAIVYGFAWIVGVLQ